MSTRFVHRNHRRRGATGLFVVATLPIILGFAALAVDTGLLYNTRVELQNAADAAALAAVQDLGGVDPYASIGVAAASALEYVQLNPVLNRQPIIFDPAKDLLFGQAALNDTGTAVQFFPNVLPPTAVQVNVHFDLDYTFAGIFGMQKRRVTARATAGIAARDFMIVIDASGSMTKQSVETEVAADLTALGIPFKAGSAVKTALTLTYDGTIPEFMGVFNVGDPFLPPSVRIMPMKAAKDAAAFAVQVVQNAGYDDLIGVASLCTPPPDAPWTQTLTVDYTTVQAKIRGLVKYCGSDLAAGIRNARLELQSPRTRNGTDKVIVLFADGQSDTVTALAEAQVAADAGMTIHSIGLGTGVDQALLTGIATIGGGTAHFVIDTTDPAVYVPQLANIFRSVALDEVGFGLIQ